MRSATRLHDHLDVVGERLEEALELPSRETLPIGDASNPICERHLEHTFREIDRNSRSRLPPPSDADDSAFRPMMPEIWEESMPSVRDNGGAAFTVVGSALRRAFH